MEIKVEFIADELKKLAGWGAQPSRLAMMPCLRSFADLPPEIMNLRREGLYIRNRVVEVLWEEVSKPRKSIRFCNHYCAAQWRKSNKK